MQYQLSANIRDNLIYHYMIFLLFYPERRNFNTSQTMKIIIGICPIQTGLVFIEDVWNSSPNLQCLCFSYNLIKNFRENFLRFFWKLNGPLRNLTPTKRKCLWVPILYCTTSCPRVVPELPFAHRFSTCFNFISPWMKSDEKIKL